MPLDNAITADILLAAFQLANEENPEAVAARIHAIGEHGDPIQFVELMGSFDLGHVAENLHRLQNRRGR
jgi:hypothetical protein